MNKFAKLADAAADRIQSQIIKISSKSSSPENTKKIQELKASLALIEKQIEDLQKLGD